MQFFKPNSTPYHNLAAQLDNDSLMTILSFVDIKTLIRSSQVSKGMRHVALTAFELLNQHPNALLQALDEIDNRLKPLLRAASLFKGYQLIAQASVRALNHKNYPMMRQSRQHLYRQNIQRGVRRSYILNAIMAFILFHYLDLENLSLIKLLPTIVALIFFISVSNLLEAKLRADAPLFYQKEAQKYLIDKGFVAFANEQLHSYSEAEYRSLVSWRNKLFEGVQARQAVEPAFLAIDSLPDILAEYALSR